MYIVSFELEGETNENKQKVIGIGHVVSSFYL